MFKVLPLQPSTYRSHFLCEPFVPSCLSGKILSLLQHDKAHVIFLTEYATKTQRHKVDTE